MRMKSLRAAAVVFACGLSASLALAQRGVGDPQGVAQQPVKPKVVSLSGDVLEVKTEPCEHTSGRSPLGTHLMMKTADGKTVNVHLGPADAVESLAKELSRGQEVKVEAFRTTKLEKSHYIARSVTIGDRTIELRDKTLRPKWAGPGFLEDGPKKIAVTAVKASLDADVDPRFGRCAYFVIMDLEEGKVETVENTNAASRGHVGPLAVQLIASKGAKVLLTGKCGPTASKALSDKGIRVVEGCSGSVRDVIKQYKEGKLGPSGDPKVVPRSGAGPRSSATREQSGSRRP
jgi:predicted Fe-Mo cluster-binding NifX family protein